VRPPRYAPAAPARAAARPGRSSQLNRASLGTAAGTLLSRVTGLLRLVVVASALGGLHLADAFNLANNTPNIVHDLVLGGILAATFVPVFVERLATRHEAEALESISAVVTVSTVLLVVATVAFVLAAPGIIDLYTLGSADPAEHAIAVELLRFFAPQLFFYGVISLISAVLATRDRFVVVGVVPVLNNLVSIVVLALFAAFAHSTSLGYLQAHQGLVVLLGVGTTLGVAVQALALVPSLMRSGIRIRFAWRLRDPAIRMILALSGWTFGFVLANQLAVFVVLALAFHIGPGAVSAYTYAFTFFQLPFGVIAVSIVNVVTPQLARAHALERPRVLGERFGTGVRQILALVLPSTVGYLLLARPIVTLLLQHHNESVAAANLTASVLALFALGLPGFCVYFLAIRAFQAMQDTRTAFVLYVLENGTNILLAFVLYRPLGVRGLALSYSVAYTVAAIVAVMVLRERLGTIGGRPVLTASLRSVLLSLVMAFAVALVSALVGSGGGIGGWLRLITEVLAGGLVYLGGAGVAASITAWQTSRRHRRRERRHSRRLGVRDPGRH